MRLSLPHVQPRRIVRRAGDRPATSGQSLVEFALIFPMFFTLLLGLIEFAFVFNATLSVNYAARDAALAGAEAGNLDGADCVIVLAVDNAIGPPTSDARIQSIEIYRADPNGGMIGAATVFTRDAAVNNTSTCALVDGSTIKYTRTANGYPEVSRCNVLNGCTGTVVTNGVDNVAVRITYRHQYVTPLSNFAGGSSGTLTFDRTSVMRMEPVL